MKENLSTKSHLRKLFKDKRQSLSSNRRHQATSHFSTFFCNLIEKDSLVLSYSSFSSEIDTTLINLTLLKGNQLVLPKVEENDLRLYLVTSPDHLLLNSYGFSEPNSRKCLKISAKDLKWAIIPGLAFDLQGNRLGFGKGFYDRFLKNLPHLMTYGVGFKEQLSTYLPYDFFDIQVKKVCLF